MKPKFHSKIKFMKQRLNAAGWLFSIMLLLIGVVTAQTDILMPFMAQFFNTTTDNPILTQHNLTVIFNNTAGTHLYNETFNEMYDGFMGDIIGNSSKFSTIYGEYYLMSMMIDGSNLGFNDSGTTVYHQVFQSNYGNITSRFIQNDNITSDDIQDGTLTGTDIQDDSIADGDVSDTLTVGNGGSVDADAIACDVSDDDLISEDCIGDVLDETEITDIYLFNNAADSTSGALTVDSNMTVSTGLNVSGGLTVNTGNVGIGTSTPLSNLQVNGSSANIRVTDTTDSISSLLKIGAGGSGGYIAGKNSSGHQNFILRSYGDSYVGIGGVGNVGIGTSTPGSTLSVSGNMSVSGALAKGSGTFTIDNPENPYEEILQHSFYESPEMLNNYRGVGSTFNDISFNNSYGWNYTADPKGNNQVRITLPSWFDDLNFKDNNYNEFTGHITGRNGFCGDSWIDFSQIQSNYFTVHTKNTCEFSWQINAVRHDPFAETNRVQVVVPKIEQDFTGINESDGEKIARKGRCIHSESCQNYDVKNPGNGKKIENPSKNAK